ncbi:MAG: hypothetical protein ABJC61_09800 [Acidobacteriota bacterium]
MTLRRWLFACAAVALFSMVSALATGQQQPIFGCRHAINCRASPVSASALNDASASGLLVSGSVRWGPGFHFGLSMPILNLPARKSPPEIDIHAFHLHDVTLLPTAVPAPSPTPTVPPASPAEPARSMWERG